MKKYISGAIIAFSLAVVSPDSAFGQWDYNSSVIDNIALDRAARRRSGGGSGRRTKAAGKRTGARKPAAVKAVVKLPVYGIQMARDSYKEFYYQDKNGFLVNFSFTSVATGKTTSISERFTLYDYQNPSIDDLPLGVYKVTATAVYKGKTYPVHIGTQEGTSDNPTGGDFAPSIRVESKRDVDDDGAPAIKLYPQKMYVRVID